MGSRLERSLVLVEFVESLLGVSGPDELREHLADVEAGVGPDGVTRFCRALLAEVDPDIADDRLLRYDRNVQEYVDHVNRNRTDPIRLRYYQYLAALYTELYLDSYYGDRRAFTAALNEFVEAANEDRETPILTYRGPDSPDLRKLAYWMATGSGKTVLLHLNYLQFVRHADGSPDNVVLVTPNENLTAQHLRALRRSSIPHRRFADRDRSTPARDRPVVDVTDVHKLGRESKEKIVDVATLSGTNLVFVDEGHKGLQSGRATERSWLALRDDVVGDGFAFEYSATFGQAINPAGPTDPVFQEYAKSILFDYSYRKFYADGYGKDYRIYNLDGTVSDDRRREWLLANFLAFYEQLRYYDDHPDVAAEYNVERPLSVFVGGTVNATRTEDGVTDVVRVLQFFDALLANEGDWAVDAIRAVLSGDHGWRTPDGTVLFDSAFGYLRSLDDSPRSIYRDILDRVFHATEATGLELVRRKRTPDEIGLRTDATDVYAGLITVGDPDDLVDAVTEKTDLRTRIDRVTPDSLFGAVDDEDSGLGILVGSRKFVEGWDCYRVATMGLLNLGRNEGSQVIQLFGRGVRLHGKRRTMKRATALEPSPPEGVRALETLNVFGIRADYVDTFESYLEDEGIPTGEATRRTRGTEGGRTGGGRSGSGPDSVSGGAEPHSSRAASDPPVVELAPDDDVRPELDLTTVARAVESRDDRGETTTQPPGSNRQEGSDRQEVGDVVDLDLLDWSRIYLDLLEYKREQGYANVIVTRSGARAVVASGNYDLYCEGEYLTVERVADLDRVEDVCRRVLEAYLDGLYAASQD